MKNFCLTALLFLMITACAGETGKDASGEMDPAPEMEEIDARQAFFANLASLCNETFSGEATFPEEPDHELVDVELTARVAECTDEEIRVPFHAGEDESRVWVISQTASGLHLRHDHRYPDGTPHETTDYGGFANDRGTPTRQYFDADSLTVEMLPEAETNVWMIEYVEAEEKLIYYLERHGEPRFRAELTRDQD